MSPPTPVSLGPPRHWTAEGSGALAASKGRPAERSKGGLRSANCPARGTSHKMLPVQVPLALKKQPSLKCEGATFWSAQAPHPAPGDDSHGDSDGHGTLRVETTRSGSPLTDPYQLIESVTAHLPGHKQNLPEMRWTHGRLSRTLTCPAQERNARVSYPFVGETCLLRVGRVWVQD